MKPVPPPALSSPNPPPKPCAGLTGGVLPDPLHDEHLAPAPEPPSRTGPLGLGAPPPVDVIGVGVAKTEFEPFVAAQPGGEPKG